MIDIEEGEIEHLRAMLNRSYEVLRCIDGNGRPDQLIEDIEDYFTYVVEAQQ